MQPFSEDIPYETALAAYRNLSHTPERRAKADIAEYANILAGDLATLEKHADTDEKRAMLTERFEVYRAKMKALWLDMLRASANCASAFITGPANFPVRQQENRHQALDNKRTAMLDYRKRFLAKTTEAMHPELRPIMSGDTDAVERLQAKVAEAERLQEHMKAVNAALRRHAKQGMDGQVAALLAMGVDQATVQKILNPVMGRPGYQSFELTNNNANIRRMQERLGVIKRNQSKETTTVEGDGVRVEDCPAENRVRLFFPGKPSEEVRARLKSRGFRWAPSIGAWQAYRNDRTIQTARDMVKEA